MKHRTTEKLGCLLAGTEIAIAASTATAADEAGVITSHSEGLHTREFKRATMGVPHTSPATGAPIQESGADVLRVEHALEEFIITINSGKTLAARPWIYTGSAARQTGLMASTAGTVITIQPNHTALINNPRPDRHNDDLHFVNEVMVPPDDVELRLTICVEKPELPSSPNTLEGPRLGPPHAGTLSPP